VEPLIAMFVPFHCANAGRDERVGTQRVVMSKDELRADCAPANDY
jgi:hypothetical protein